MANIDPRDAPDRIALRPNEAAQALGVSLRCLMDWVKAGEVPHTRLGPRCLRFPVDGLRQWVASRTSWPTTIAVKAAEAGSEA